MMFSQNTVELFT